MSTDSPRKVGPSVDCSEPPSGQGGSSGAGAWPSGAWASEVSVGWPSDSGEEESEDNSEGKDDEGKRDKRDKDEEEDAALWTCSVCGVALGKLRMQPRHHCRICGGCVCSGCSRSTVRLADKEKLQRACSLCVSYAQRTRAIQGRTLQLGRRLHSCCGAIARLPASAQVDGVEQAVHVCEAALPPLRWMFGRLAALQAWAEHVEPDILAGGPLGGFGAGDGGVGASASASDTALSAAPSSPPPACGGGGPAAGSETFSSSTTTATMVTRTPSVSTVTSSSTVFGDPQASPPRSPARRSRTPDDAPPRSWEADAETCGVCGIALGKRHLRPRHHCRLCGRCVCAGCSPSEVTLEGRRGKQRACTPCVAYAEQANAMAKRLVDLATRLFGLARLGTPAPLSRPGDFEEAVALCEAVLAPIEDARQRLVALQARVDRANASHAQVDYERRISRSREGDGSFLSTSSIRTPQLMLAELRGTESAICSRKCRIGRCFIL